MCELLSEENLVLERSSHVRLATQNRHAQIAQI